MPLHLKQTFPPIILISTLLQGISSQTDKINLALVKVYIMIFADILDPMCSLERHFYAKFISFYFFDVARPLEDDMQKLKKKIEKNSLNVTSVKLLSKKFFDDFGCFLMLSCFQPLILSKNVCI